MEQQQQWTPYAETPASSRQSRYAPHAMTTPQQPQRDSSVPQIKQDMYNSPPAGSRSSMALQSTSSHGRGEYNDGDGDVRMEDAQDPYKPKHSASRSVAQVPSRQSQQFLQQEESAAARRYSPMNLSPTSPYPGTTQQGGQQYQSFTPGQSQSNRQSPARNNPYISPPNPYYSPPGMSPAQSLSPNHRRHHLAPAY